MEKKMLYEFYFCVCSCSMKHEIKKKRIRKKSKLYVITTYA